ncbi:MAG TPA: histidine kinase dimerization/phosphoacceptor domain -containing protein [Vitreimonas sp.]|uniref:sensor histidine kinase n=1 Tax=Vitreimonas sp. TaxID=3069702 RepID=UPI002D526B54|nr:histidine kinase dimerization/phosphoacceptor domain -containing protein [Vitreimonas sp.]HYD88027.1 histidine kinase dimerization/phosphoacceptor domain -containing protein [Vitreimonas sp.]
MALLLGLAMLPAGAIAMQVGLNGVAARQAAYEESLGRQALQSISVEKGVIDEVREMMRVLATTPALPQIEAGDCRQWLGEVVARYPYVASIAVTDENRAVRCSYPQAPAGLRAPRSDLRDTAMARDAFTIGFVEHGAITQQPVLAALEPIRDGSRRIGFVGAAITVAQLRELLDRSRELDGARAAIVDASGRIIAQSSPLPGRPEVGLPRAHQIRNHLGPDPGFVRVDDGGAVIVPLHAPDLYIVMSWPSDQPAWRRWGQVIFSLAAPLLIWLLAVAAGWFAIEVFVARPLSSVEAAARNFARGGEDVADPPPLRSAPEEIRSLRRTLGAMAKTLRGRETRLVEALAEERALLREVHHRVKNNLQMVASLLNIQARNARDESEAWGLARAHDRVQLLALVHQRIYASGEVRELRIDDLFAEICRQLVQSRGAQVKDVALALHFEPARAFVDRAMPLAFLIGEGLSAALDALADVGSVTLSIYLHQDADGAVRFAVDADAAEATVTAPSPGARLIEAFARQLGASVGRNPDRPFMLWVSVPAPKEEEPAQPRREPQPQPA